MCFGENTGFTLHTFARKTKVSIYKVSATFAQGVIEFAIKEDHRKTQG